MSVVLHLISKIIMAILSPFSPLFLPTIPYLRSSATIVYHPLISILLTLFLLLLSPQPILRLYFSQVARCYGLELEALERNGTLSLVMLPLSKHGIGCKWVYKIKCQVDGSLEQYKARLVAKGYTQ